LLVPADQQAVHPLRGQQIAEIRTGDLRALAHLASVLTNEFALADLGLTTADFHAVFDGALRAPADSASRSH
jgi:hypothetical protein